jgi:hypothetical protein
MSPSGPKAYRKHKALSKFSAPSYFDEDLAPSSPQLGSSRSTKFSLDRSDTNNPKDGRILGQEDSVVKKSKEIHPTARPAHRYQSCLDFPRLSKHRSDGKSGPTATPEQRMKNIRTLVHLRFCADTYQSKTKQAEPVSGPGASKSGKNNRSLHRKAGFETIRSVRSDSPDASSKIDMWKTQESNYRSPTVHNESDIDSVVGAANVGDW